MIPFYSDITLMKNQACSLLFEKLPVAPTDAAESQVYYNTVDKCAYVYNGTTWVALRSIDSVTYTFAEGSLNGTFIATDSNGNTQTVVVHGLNTGAYKEVDTSIAAGSTSANLPTSQAVAAYVDSRVASATHYKGTVGSTGDIPDLPTSDVQEGDLYIVETAGTYADEYADVGDMYLAKNAIPEWSHIASGDDKFTASNPVLTASGDVCTWTVAHNLGSRFVTVSVYDLTTNQQVFTDVSIVSNNALTVQFKSASDIAADLYQVVVTG